MAYFTSLHSNKLKNLSEIDTFLGTSHLSSVNQEDINNLSRYTISNKVESALKRHLQLESCFRKGALAVLVF